MRHCAFALNPSTKAVLKPPHSKRWRNELAPANFAKRLECGAFTAAFSPERSGVDHQLQHARHDPFIVNCEDRPEWRLVKAQNFFAEALTTWRVGQGGEDELPAKLLHTPKDLLSVAPILNGFLEGLILRLR